MFYCSGTNCAKKDICKHHFTEGVVQVIDWSTMGSCSTYDSKTGRTIVGDGYYCGDNGDYDKFVSIYEDMIKERIDLCDRVIQPFIESSEEDLTGKMLSMTTVNEWINALGQKTMEQIHEEEKDHPTLAVYDHYMGRLEGI